MSKQIRVTVPEPFYKQLQKIAKNTHRSLSNQCLVMLEFAMRYPTAPTFTLTPMPASPENPTGGYEITATTGIGKYKKPVTTVVTSQPKFIRPDGEPFTLTDFEQYLPDTDNEYYKKIKKSGTTTGLTAVLREGARLSEKDFIEYLKEEYITTIYMALDIPMSHDLSKKEWQEIAGYLTPHIPENN